MYFNTHKLTSDICVLCEFVLNLGWVLLRVHNLLGPLLGTYLLHSGAPEALQVFLDELHVVPVRQLEVLLMI